MKKKFISIVLSFLLLSSTLLYPVESYAADIEGTEDELQDVLPGEFSDDADTQISDVIIDASEDIPSAAEDNLPADQDTYDDTDNSDDDISEPYSEAGEGSDESEGIGSDESKYWEEAVPNEDISDETPSELFEDDQTEAADEVLLGAGGDIASGSYEDTEWRITSAGELIVTGEGDAYDPYSSYPNSAPWYKYRTKIKKATVNIDGLIYFTGFFSGCTNLKQVDFGDMDMSSVYDISDMFYQCSSIESIDLSGHDLSSVRYLTWAFGYCTSLKNVYLDGLDTSNVVSMSGMFDNCHNLETVDVSSWDTSNVTSMAFMFRNCNKINGLDVSNWDTSNVEDMRYLFAWCYAVEELDVSKWDTSSVVNMIETFQYCENLEVLDVSHFDTSNVEDMAGMFNGCKKLKVIDVSNWDTSNTIHMPWLFSVCPSLESVDLSSFDTSNVTYMWYMFYGCESLQELDVSSFNTESLVQANSMFQNCTGLKELDLSSFSLPNVSNVKDMLAGNSNLETIISPTNSALAISLPGKNWKRLDTLKSVSSIPAHLEESISFFSGSVELAFDNSTFEMNKSETAEIALTVSPEGVDLNQVVWTSSDNNIATVEGTETGAVITAGGKEGTATITANLAGNKATATVKVMTPISLNKGLIVFTAVDGAEDTVKLSVIDSYKPLVSETFVDADGHEVNDLLTFSRNDNFEYTISLNDDLEIAESTTVFFKVYALKDEKEVSDTCKITINPIPTVQEPIASPYGSGEACAVNIGSYVSLKSGTYGATIFYTTDGITEPAVDSEGKPADGVLRYTDRIRLVDNVTIKAMAYKAGYRQSAIKTYKYTIIEDQWGDLQNETAIQDLFDNKSSNVPDDLWYVIGDNIYLQSGATDYEETYTGNKCTFNDKIAVYFGTSKLSENRDYTVSYTNNQNVASLDAENPKTHKSTAPTIVIKGKGNYSKTASFRFAIVPRNIDESDLTSEPVVAVTAGAKVLLTGTKPLVSYEGKKLTPDKDYEITYYEGETTAETSKVADPTHTFLNTANKIYTAQISAKDGGNFTGIKEETVIIRTIDGADKTIVPASKLKYGNALGKAIQVPYDKTISYSAEELFDNSGDDEPLAYVYLKGAKKDALIYGTDFEVTLTDTDNTSVGSHGFTITGIGKYIGTKTGSYQIFGTSLKSVKMAGLNTSVEYTGSAITIEDLFKEDKVTKDPNGDRNTSDAWSGVTLYTIDKSTKAKNVLKRYDATAETDTEFITSDITEADYRLEMSNTGAIGKFTLSFVGVNGYSDIITKTVSVKAYNVKNDSRGRIVVDDIEDVTWAKAGAKPSVSVKYVTEWNTAPDGNNTTPKTYLQLREGIDYTLSYKNNMKPSAGATKNLPTAVIKGKGNYSGANLTKTFTINKANVEDNISLAVNDVVYKSNGKAGYFLVVPKLMDDEKAVTSGKNKEVEAIAKQDYKYYYAEDTVLNDKKTKKYGGTEVNPSDQVAPGTLIRVVATVVVKSSASPYQYTDGTLLSATYRVIGEGKDISKYTAKINDVSKLSYRNGESIVPLKEADISITYTDKATKETKKLEASDYEIVSIRNNRFLGTATVTVKGLGEYGGTRIITFKIGVKPFS